MKKLLVIFAAALSVLLAVGCIAEDQQTGAADNSTPANTMPVDVQNFYGANSSNDTSSVQAPPSTPASADACTVEFQRGMGETYYVMVKTAASGTVTVSCPDGADAERTGNAFFCQKLSMPAPVVAYLDGTVCGSARFLRDEPRTSGAKGMCTIEVAPKRIIAGDSVTVTVHAITSGSQFDLSYDCGNGEISRRIEGIYTETQLCKYQSSGTASITARLNGAPCASTNITIYSSPRGCGVQDAPMNLTVEKGENIYRGIVYGHGYGSNDELVYRCFGDAYSVRVGNIPSSADFEYTVECRSKLKLDTPVRVTVSKMECGSMMPP